MEYVFHCTGVCSSYIYVKHKQYFSVVITAVEMMLDKFDRRISDRFKIIDYKEEDNAKLVSALPNHITNVALPVALGLAAFILICFCCARDSSPVCKLCKSKI